jgi:hypothetical protein
MLCSLCVLDTVYHLGYTRAHPGPTGARSRGVADVGRGAVLPQASQACWREALGSRVLVQVSTPQRTACEEASWLFHQHRSSSRAARRTSLDQPDGSEPHGSGPTGAGSWICDRCWNLDRRRPSTHRRHHTLPRHGRACPGHDDGTSAALLHIGITRTSPAMTLENARAVTEHAVGHTSVIPPRPGSITAAAIHPGAASSHGFPPARE